MEIKIVALATLLSAVICAPVAFGSSPTAALNNAGSGTAPSIEFLRPVKNEIFNDLPISVQLSVNNFKLVPPSQHGQPSQPGSGYIEYTMDDFPICCAGTTQLMFGKNIGRKYIPAGRHVFRAELKDSNNQPLSPPVIAETFAWSGHPAARESMRSAVGSPQSDFQQEELHKVQQQLDQVQQELLRLQNGSAGYQPMMENVAPNATE